MCTVDSESRDTLPDDARRTLEAVEFFFQEKEKIYNESLDRRKEKEANAKFSQGFQIAGQVARKYLAYEIDVKNKIRLSYAGGDPVPWFFSNPPKPEKAIAVPDTEKMAIIKQLKETSMLSEVKKADGLPSNLTGYLNAPDRATMDREYSVVAARVAAIALRDDTTEFEQLVDKTVVSPGSQLSMLSKLCGQAAQREQWNQKAKYAEVGWPIIESSDEICGKVIVSQNMKTCLLGTVRAYFGQFGIAQAMEFLLEVKHDGSDEDKKLIQQAYDAVKPFQNFETQYQDSNGMVRDCLSLKSGSSCGLAVKSGYYRTLGTSSYQEELAFGEYVSLIERLLENFLSPKEDGEVLSIMSRILRGSLKLDNYERERVHGPIAGQPIEALFAAQYTMSIASVSGTEPLYVKLDIRGAFDNLKHSSVAAYLANLPPAITFEASRLLHFLLHQNFMFSFLQEDWEHHTSNGTPQGGSHSAGLFARTLDYAIGQVTSRWDAAGHSPPFPPMWLLLYVDDSQLALSTKPPNHLLGPLADFQWTSGAQYLRRPFGFDLGHDALLQSAIQSIYNSPEEMPLGATLQNAIDVESIYWQDFDSQHLARVLMAHVMGRHVEGLCRTGPWHTVHSLLQKFWATHQLPHDYMYQAQDREAWKTTGQCFLEWMGYPQTIVNVEILAENPWESKGSLLRQQTQWLHTAILTVHGNLLMLAWLDTVEGYSMDCQPFVQQFAIAQSHVWDLFCDDEGLCHHCFRAGTTAWYQMK
eukprot:Skav210098  [mRNA]  locus=scaffold1510:459500:462923:- [translate_table: standard]